MTVAQGGQAIRACYAGGSKRVPGRKKAEGFTENKRACIIGKALGSFLCALRSAGGEAGQHGNGGGRKSPLPYSAAFPETKRGFAGSFFDAKREGSLFFPYFFSFAFFFSTSCARWRAASAARRRAEGSKSRGNIS